MLKHAKTKLEYHEIPKQKTMNQQFTNAVGQCCTGLRLFVWKDRLQRFLRVFRKQQIEITREINNNINMEYHEIMFNMLLSIWESTKIPKKKRVSVRKGDLLRITCTVP